MNWRKKKKKHTQQNSSYWPESRLFKVETVKSLQLFEGIFMGMSNQGEGEGNINERRESKELRGRHGKQHIYDNELIEKYKRSRIKRVNLKLSSEWNKE